MKETSDNKSLVKLKDNIFSKTKKFFLRLLKYDIKKDYADIEEVIPNNQTDKSDDKNEFINQLKEMENSDTNAFNLQTKYENGDLKVSDMSEDEYSKIEDLYNRQIENLTNQIKIKKAKLSTN